MNRIQRAATAAIAFTITLVGSVSVIAPLALGNVHTLTQPAARAR